LRFPQFGFERVQSGLKRLIGPGLNQFAGVLPQFGFPLRMAAISASDISSGCFLVCSLRSIHSPASLACAVVAATMAVGWLNSFATGVEPLDLCGFKLANEDVDTRSLQHYLGHKNIL
jgi:hypothetical protein